MLISATYQCCQSVPPISAMPVSAAYQCQSVLPISANQCRLSVLPLVPISATYQCLLISASYQCPSVQPH
ncbi:unnamed protein product [Staurois parvus]|uniref:Uncharacterized protein n=1 Tax=Staurois parvus TaxID=386267 RepID=A0ABN9DUJ5_9NEOB|nr:unnamed protein product [Staurois parvus]